MLLACLCHLTAVSWGLLASCHLLRGLVSPHRLHHHHHQASSNAYVVTTSSGISTSPLFVRVRVDPPQCSREWTSRRNHGRKTKIKEIMPIVIFLSLLFWFVIIIICFWFGFGWVYLFFSFCVLFVFFLLFFVFFCVRNPNQALEGEARRNQLSITRHQSTVDEPEWRRKTHFQIAMSCFLSFHHL
jgi:hypothetical protein